MDNRKHPEPSPKGSEVVLEEDTTYPGPAISSSFWSRLALALVVEVIVSVLIFGATMSPSKKANSGWMSDMGKSLFGFLSGNSDSNASPRRPPAERNLPVVDHLSKRSRKRPDTIQPRRRSSVTSVDVQAVAKAKERFLTPQESFEEFNTPRGSIDQSVRMITDEESIKRKESELRVTAKKIFAEILNEEDFSDSETDGNKVADKGIIADDDSNEIADSEEDSFEETDSVAKEGEANVVTPSYPSQSEVMGRKSKKKSVKRPQAEPNFVTPIGESSETLPIASSTELSEQHSKEEVDGVALSQIPEEEAMLIRSDPDHIPKDYSKNSISEQVQAEEEEEYSKPIPKKSRMSVDDAQRLYKTLMGMAPNKAQFSDDDESIGDSESEDEHDSNGVRMREERRREATKNLSSRRSSTDSSEDGFNLNVRDLKNELREVEEKFRKAMVANAGLDNDKAQLNYQVDLLKDQLEEKEEQNALVVRELREKNRDFELMKRSYAEAQRAVQLLQAQLDEQMRLLSERGMVLIGQEDCDDEVTVDESEQEKRTRAIVSNETANILSGIGHGPLDVRIKRLADEKDDLQDSIRRLKLDLEEERNRNARLEKTPFNPEEADWETKKLIDDYKFKMQKSEQDINTLQTNVARLESQVVRFKTAAETSEKSEEELKTERRKLQRELREATSRVEELETANKHLEARLGKLKTAKSNLLKEL